MRVSSAEFLKKYGAMTDQALTEPVTITRNGRDRLVLMSAEEYARLKRRDRRVLIIEELSDADIVQVVEARVPDDQAHLDDELKTWRP